MTIKNAKELQKIRKEIEEALKSVAEKNGIQNIKLGTMRHNSDGFKVSLEAQYEGGESIEMRKLIINAPFLGFKKEIAGAMIQYAGKNLKVIGIKNTKMLLGEKDKTYNASIEDVKKVLRNQKSEYVID